MPAPDREDPFMSLTCEVNKCMHESMAIQLNVLSVPVQGPRASPVRGHAQASDYMKVATGGGWQGRTPSGSMLSSSWSSS